jgi:SecD/SecF fusion protein
LKKAILIVCAVVIGGILCLLGISALLRREATTPLSQPPSHGVSFLIEADAAPSGRATNDLALLKDVLLKRADRVGVRIYWEPVSEERAHVAVATGISVDTDVLRRALFQQGQLEFRLVHEQSDLLIEAGELPPGHVRLKRELRLPPLAGRVETVIVKKKPEPWSNGNMIKRAMVSRGNSGEPEISFILKPEVAKQFAAATRENLGRRLAILIDGELYSAPIIQSPIETGAGVITGQFDLQEAVQLARALDCPFPFPVKIIESKNF